MLWQEVWHKKMVSCTQVNNSVPTVSQCPSVHMLWIPTTPLDPSGLRTVCGRNVEFDEGICSGGGGCLAAGSHTTVTRRCPIRVCLYIGAGGQVSIISLKTGETGTARHPPFTFSTKNCLKQSKKPPKHNTRASRFHNCLIAIDCDVVFPFSWKRRPPRWVVRKQSEAKPPAKQGVTSTGARVRHPGVVREPGPVWHFPPP